MAETIYDAAGGAEGMLRLAHAWHVRVLDDPVVFHAFEHGFREDHSERLAAYLGEALGGPAVYTGELGGDETDVVRIHSGNGEHHEMDRHALDAWDAALADCGYDADPRLAAALHDFFADGIRRMGEHEEDPGTVPDGLHLDQWTWESAGEIPEHLR